MTYFYKHPECKSLNLEVEQHREYKCPWIVFVNVTKRNHMEKDRIKNKEGAGPLSV